MDVYGDDASTFKNSYRAIAECDQDILHDVWNGVKSPLETIMKSDIILLKYGKVIDDAVKEATAKMSNEFLKLCHHEAVSRSLDLTSYRDIIDIEMQFIDNLEEFRRNFLYLRNVAERLTQTCLALKYLHDTELVNSAKNVWHTLLTYYDLFDCFICIA